MTIPTPPHNPSAEFLRFAVAGATGFAVDAGLVLLLNSVFGWLSGASAGVRPPRAAAAGQSRPDRVSSGQGSNGVSGHCTTKFENTHMTTRREVLYWLHPWAGREVSIHAVIDKADGVVFRCTPDGSETERWLEIPAWMFYRASCARDQTLTVRPFVGLDALMALSALLARSMEIASQSSNPRLSGA